MIGVHTLITGRRRARAPSIEGGDIEVEIPAHRKRFVSIVALDGANGAGEGGGALPSNEVARLTNGGGGGARTTSIEFEIIINILLLKLDDSRLINNLRSSEMELCCFRSLPYWMWHAHEMHSRTRYRMVRVQ